MAEKHELSELVEIFTSSKWYFDEILKGFTVEDSEFFGIDVLDWLAGCRMRNIAVDEVRAWLRLRVENGKAGVK